MVSGKITAFDDQTLAIELKTKEDLRKYRDSFWAVRIYLSYQPETVTATSALSGYEPVAREFVFSIEPQPSMERTSDGHYLTTWLIPRTRRFTWSSTNYSYHIGLDEEIRLRLGGATMHGTSLESNELRLKMPIKTSTAQRP